MDAFERESSTIQEIRRAIERFREAEHQTDEGELVAGRPEWNYERATAICTNSAMWMRFELKGRGAKVFGYYSEDNPTAKAGEDEGGHDFLVVDGFIVDIWLNEMYKGPLVTRLDDKRTVREWYGDPKTWRKVPVPKDI